MTNLQGKHFLFIEDDQNDALLIKRAFQSVESCSAFVARNLSEGKAYLTGAGMYADRSQFPFPNAIVCDFTVGGDDGLDFVRWLRADETFSSMHVIVLSTNDSDANRSLVKEAGGNDFLRKPTDYDQMRLMVADLVAKLCT